MRSVEVSITVGAPARTCFEFVADPTNVTRYMSVNSYRAAGRRKRGLGARFTSTLEVGGREFEALLEITEWEEFDRIVATSIKGPTTRGSWSFKALKEESTRVTLLHEYELPGVLRFLPQGPINAGVERELKKSMRRLKKLIEA